MRWQKQSQSKIPLANFSEIYLFACFTAFVCCWKGQGLFCKRLSLLHTHPQQSDIQAGIKGIDWPEEVSPPKQMQRKSVQYQCYIYFVMSQVSQAVSVNKSSFAGCSTEAERPEIWEGKFHLHRFKKKKKPQKEFIFSTRIDIHMIHKRRKIAFFIAPVP